MDPVMGVLHVCKGMCFTTCKVYDFDQYDLWVTWQILLFLCCCFFISHDNLLVVVYISPFILCI